jgi:hypothetical protein
MYQIPLPMGHKRLLLAMERTPSLSSTLRQWVRMAIVQHGAGVLDIAVAQRDAFMKENNPRLAEACQDLIDAIRLELPSGP